MKVEHQVRSFLRVLELYDGTEPLHRFLPTYFRQNRQMGSSDRRWATRYCYSYFRIGKALAGADVLKKTAVADFLCHPDASLIVQVYLSDLASAVALPLEEKLTLVKNHFPEFKTEQVFEWLSELSLEIDKKAFSESFFIQPDLFIRTDEKLEATITGLLAKTGITFGQPGPGVISLPNGTKLENIIPSAINYQVQDHSSQKTGRYFSPQKGDYWWDCCAASGGKSLLLHSIEPDVKLLVSDIRENSLANLDTRFKQVGIRSFHKKVLDLRLNNDQVLFHYAFDGILLDAPCTGSGTWGRTPEMLTYFSESKIAYYAQLQKELVTQVVKYLKSDKPLIYMTCSVFKAENEDVVHYICENLPVKLEKAELIKGYGEKADTMFVARFVKQ